MWLFADRAVYEECGPYVHKGPGMPVPWPRLAWYYARLKPPHTVGDWIHDCKVDLETMDVRRFISFGVIKGFLRRVHRWPILLKDDKLPLPPSISKRRHKSINLTAAPLHGTKKAIEKEVELQMGNLGANPEVPPGLGSAAAMAANTRELADQVSATRPIATTSALPNDAVRPMTGIGSFLGASSIPRDPPDKEGRAAKQTPAAAPVQMSSSYAPQPLLKGRLGMGLLSYDSTGNEEEDPQAVSLPIAQELASQAYTQGQAVAKLKGVAAGGALVVEVPPELSELLDGTHHSDELCVHFGQSWNVLRATLGVIGGGTGDDGDLGRVVILYR
jgi:nitrogen permease regulator 2-like protein